MQEWIPTIRIIVPVRNEAPRLAQLLDSLQTVREKVLLVDCGSSDETIRVCEQAGFKVIQTSPGRATQMNHGASHADADCYWFLHADCVPADNAIEEVMQACQQGYLWGRFDVRLSGKQPVFRIIEKMMNWRSCLTQVATGDQGIFVRRTLFEEIGGFPDVPLMEDIAMSKLLRRRGRGSCVATQLRVSSRRWESRGIFQTVLLMWWLRLRYVLGASPVDLHKAYYG